MEIKSISHSIQDVGVKEGIVSGYLSAFGNIDSDRDMIIPNAYDRTIKEWGPNGKRRIKYFLDHDSTKAIGVFTVLREDQKGLYYEAKVGDWSLGVDFLKMVDAGAISEHSVGFKTIKKEDAGDHTRITEIKLYEGSALQGWGANEMTPIVASKSLEEVESYFLKLQKILKYGDVTDETMIRIESYCKALEPYFKTTNPNIVRDNVNLPDEVKNDDVKINLSQIFKTALS